MKKRTAKRFIQTLPPSLQVATDDKVRMIIFSNSHHPKVKKAVRK